MTGAGDEMADVSRAIERAEERTDEMEARAAAMDELEDTGAFEDALSDKDSIDRELEAGRASSEVDSELETLKAELGKSSAPSSGDADTDVDVEAEAESETETATDDPAVEAELEELRNEEDA
jgi:phage shock protein A